MLTGLSRPHAFVINDQGQPSPLATHLSPWNPSALHHSCGG